MAHLRYPSVDDDLLEVVQWLQYVYDLELLYRIPLAMIAFISLMSTKRAHSDILN
jgi:hypothetical protein